MISKEERAEWRGYAAKVTESGKRNGGCHVLLFGEDMNRLLDALEAAEAHAEQAESTINTWEHGSDCNTCPLQNEPACDAICFNKAILIRFCADERGCAEAAERERDALAKVAADVACWNCPIGKQHKCLELPEPDCSTMLLEWARQQVRGEGKE